jgi:short-subunit dehydrogenase
MMLKQYYYKRNILLIGASQGIGEAVAMGLSKYNCNLWLAARNVDKLQEICVEINHNNLSKAHFSKCDVTNKDDISATIHNAKECLGSIDIAIINSGINGSEGKNFNSDVFKKIYSVNYFGVLHCLDFLIPLMKEQGGGVIAATSSLADARGFPGSGAYSSSKIALSHTLEAIKFDLNNYNIDILTIKPGFVRTNMTAKIEYPMPFIISTESAAKYIIKGIYKKKHIIAFPASISFFSNLGRIVPNWLFNLVFKGKFFKF